MNRDCCGALYPFFLYQFVRADLERMHPRPTRARPLRPADRTWQRTRSPESGRQTRAAGVSRRRRGNSDGTSGRCTRSRDSSGTGRDSGSGPEVQRGRGGT
eukprot:3721601-Pyramimonas_sp.AAC.1